MTSTMHKSSDIVSDAAAGGGPRTCRHGAMGFGSCTYLSWCTQPLEVCAYAKRNAKITQFLRNIRGDLLYIHVRIAAADIGNARGRIRAFYGAPWQRGM